MAESTENTLKQLAISKKKPAHEVLYKEIETELSSLSGLKVTQQDRTESLHNIEADCNILGKMDIPEKVYSVLEKQISDLIKSTNAEITAKTTAANTISVCLQSLNADKNKKEMGA